MVNKLADLSIMVMRPEARGKALCQKLINDGATVLHFPTIAFHSLSHTKDFQIALENIPKQDWLIFVSPQAVLESIAAIKKRWPVLPNVRFAAIGRGTGEHLQKAGYEVTYPEDDWRSEGLLALPAFQSVHHQSIMIVKGRGGRELLAQQLTKASAKVTYLVPYERILPKTNVESCLLKLQQKQIDVVIGTSFESIKNLKTLLGNQAWQTVQKIPMIVVSERIKALAEDLGLETLWVAEQASDEKILEMLVQKKDVLCQKMKIKL